ncbi:TPA: hypothetical protein RTH17_001855 [Campylobacter jejuni]|nr:hypothetical protein [Campylobacter jejuni]HDZ4984581.1 hypothetical protein [Campylobacter jejuni]HDZ4996211.1 hypothetical protein [Campylobacter jejuni]HDZ5081434.1 hypothetical protein [Campylobacter jejuni]
MKAKEVLKLLKISRVTLYKYVKNSSVAKIINAEKTGYKTLKEAWMAWNKSQNKVMQGLINRRNAEYKLYTQGVYEKW